jgi:hypothetical protein
VVEHLLCKCEAMSSNPSSNKKKTAGKLQRPDFNSGIRGPGNSRLKHHPITIPQFECKSITFFFFLLILFLSNLASFGNKVWYVTQVGLEIYSLLPQPPDISIT